MKGIDQVVNTVGGLLDIGDNQDAVSILKRDHREAEAVFLQWSNARTENKKMQLMHQYIKMLSIHASVEEDLVYPLLEDSKEKKTHTRTKEALEEHHLLKMALADLADAKPGSEELEAKMQVINELVKHHVKEEESGLLPALKKSGVNLDRLGQQVLQRKKQLMSDVTRGDGIGKNKQNGQTRKSGTAVAASTALQRKAKTASKSAAKKTAAKKTATGAVKSSAKGKAKSAGRGKRASSSKKSSSSRATASKSRKSTSTTASKKSVERKSSGSSSAAKKTASGRSSTGRTAANKRRTARKEA